MLYIKPVAGHVAASAGNALWLGIVGLGRDCWKARVGYWEGIYNVVGGKLEGSWRMFRR